MEMIVDGVELQQVIEFAVKAHAGQVRKHSGLPYICHPMAVVSQLAQWDIVDNMVWKAGFCHDVLEDCPISLEELRQVIGVTAASVVEELTFVFDPGSLYTKKEQKAQYMDTFYDKSVHALVVKAADRVLNSLDFLNTDSQYARKYWLLGQTVFRAIIQKKEQISELFGPSTFPRLMHTRSNLNGVFQ